MRGWCGYVPSTGTAVILETLINTGAVQCRRLKENVSKKKGVSNDDDEVQ